MKTRMAAVLLALALALMGSPAISDTGTNEFTVLSLSPQGEVSTLQELRISFSVPAISQADVGKILSEADLPFEIRPEVAGRGRWTDDRTFVFSPLSELRPATRYDVTLKEQLRDVEGRLLAGRHSFAMSTPRPRLLSVKSINFTRSREVTLGLEFNLPISPVRLRGFLTLKDDGGRIIDYSIEGRRPSARIEVKTRPLRGDSLLLSIAPGLASDVGPLGLKEEVRQKIVPSFRLTISGGNALSFPSGRGRINIETTAPVDIHDLRGFVEVEPQTDFNVEPTYSGFALVGSFAPRQRIVLTLKKGLPAIGKSRLEKDYRRAFVFPDVQPFLRFPSSGRFLSPAGDLKIPIESVNVDHIEFRLWKLYENNIPFALGGAGRGITSDISRLVRTANTRIECGLNTTERRAIDLRELAQDARGVFLLTARDMEHGHYSSVSQVVAATDLGIAARLYSRGMLIWVNSISGGLPAAEAEIRVYSRSNQIVATGTTDENGLCLIERSSPWQPQLRPNLITVKQGEDLSFLRLDHDLQLDGNFEITGRPWIRSGYEALCFTPRGVFRPGERVQARTIVRDGDGHFEKPFPVLCLLHSSRGREIARRNIMLSTEGTGEFSVNLAEGTPTGEYSIEIFIPGEKEPLGRCRFYVEDFAPPRLEIELKGDRPLLMAGETLKIDMTSRYLFGAPAAKLPWEGEVRVIPRRFTSPLWRSFDFGDGEKSFRALSNYIESGKLDGSGKAVIPFSPDRRWTPPSMLDLVFRFQVMEQSGRWVTRNLTVPYHPYPLHVGIEIPKGELPPGKKRMIRVAAVTPEGEPAPTSTLEATVSKVIRHHVLVNSGYRTRIQSQEEIVERSSEPLTMDNGIGTFNFLPQDEGEYLLRFTDEESGSSASLRLFSWRPFGDSEIRGSDIPDLVKLTPDRKSYRPGEEASIRIRAPFRGTLLFTVEAEQPLLSRIIRMDDLEKTVKFDVTEEMARGAYCSAWIIRPVEENTTWNTHRALGIIPLDMDRSDKRLRINLNAPMKIAPGENLPISVELLAADGTPAAGEVMLMLVDEGILALTNYGTPDPWAFFTARRRIDSRAFDLYDELMPLESRNTPLLHPGGGDGENMMASLAANLSPVRTQRFKPFAILESPLKTDANGRVETEIAIPEFSGRARLMAVAVSRTCFGSTERQVEIARDIVTEATLPRAVAPDDHFTVPVTLFSKAARPLSVHLEVLSSGSLELDGPSSFDVELEPSGKSAPLEISLAASERAGTGIATFRTQWEGHFFEETLEMPVRPPFPRISLSGSGRVEPGRKTSFDISERWMEGTEDGRIVLSGTPSIDLFGAAKFLMAYPYGCLEQIVSGAWPLLVAPSIAAEVDPLLANPDELGRQLERVIARIQTLQLYDGSFTSWHGDEYTNAWGSIYACHFLVEASRAGVSVSPDLLNSSLSWLRRYLSAIPETDTESDWRDASTAKAYATYVLALHGRPSLGWMTHLSENLQDLRSSGRILLAGAYGLAGEESEAKKRLGGLVPSLSDRPKATATLDSGIRDMALKLLVWVDIDPMSSEAATLAGELLETNRRGLWQNTQENGMAVLAIGRYLKRTAPAAGNFLAEIRNGAGTLVTSMDEGDRLSLAIGEIGPSPWNIESSGDGNLYYAWTTSGIPEELPEETDRGIRIRRTLRNRNGEKLHSGDPIPQGSLVEIELAITPTGSARNLVVADLLPGGMEIESPHLEKEDDYQGLSRPIHVEARDDRLILFLEKLDRPITFRYSVRAVTKGDYVQPPASVEGMYNPGLRSLWGGGRIRIK